MKRLRSKNNDNVILVTVPRKQACVDIRNIENRSFLTGDDDIFYSIDFKPPLSPKDAQKTKIQVTCQSKKRPCVGSINISLNNNNKKQKQSIGNYKYHVYETHALELDPKNQKNISRLYFKIENNQLRANDETIVLEPSIDMGHTFLSNLFGKRYIGLPYYPPEPNLIEKLGIPVASEDVSQRSPAWYKSRGTLSGSKAYQLLGFFLPSPQSVDANWSFDAPKEFSKWSKANMRFGTLREDHMVIAYLLWNKNALFKEVGWCNAPRPRYPPTWGASPDGVIIDKTMSWNTVPESIRKYYTPQKQELDITRGAAEFKASKNNCKMQAYYYPQVYMEMIALETIWTDLVRYCEKVELNAQGKWVKKRVFRIYRIYRHKKTEQWLITLLKRALKNKKNILELVQTQEYVDIRNYFTKLAERAEYTEIPLEKYPEIEETLQQYEKHKKQVISDSIQQKEKEEEEEENYQDTWAQIEENHMDLFRYFETHNQKKFASTFADQMKLYADILKQLTT